VPLRFIRELLTRDMSRLLKNSMPARLLSRFGEAAVRKQPLTEPRMSMSGANIRRRLYFESLLEVPSISKNIVEGMQSTC
jgi:hypothetical protein